MHPCFSLLESPLNMLLPSHCPPISGRREWREREREPNKLGLKHPRLAYWKKLLEKVRADLNLMRQGCNGYTENSLQSQLKLWWYLLRASRCMHAVSLGLLNELQYVLVICLTLTGRDWWISSGHTCVSPRLDTCVVHQHTTVWVNVIVSIRSEKFRMTSNASVLRETLLWWFLFIDFGPYI